MVRNKGSQDTAVNQTYIKAGSNLVIPRADLAIRKSYLIEVPINNVGVGSQNPFQRDNVLNPDSTGSVKFIGVEVMTDALLLRAPSGNTVVNAAEAASLTFTYVWNDNEFIKDAPYSSFITANNYGIVRRLNRVKIALTKSYVTVLAAGIAANRSVLFNFYYE